MNSTGGSLVVFPIPYVCFGFLGAVWLLAVVPFFFLVYYGFAEINEQYNTVSSFCADPTKPGNRFLLVMCCIIGVCLAVIYCDEYNSLASPISTARTVRFSLRFSSAALLPLVGLFYTRNKLALPHVPQQYDFGCAYIPVLVSDVIHSACALYFLLASALCGVWGATELGSVALQVCAMGASFLLIVFLHLQAFIRIFLRDPNCYLQKLHHVVYASSFAIEFLCILALVLVNVFVSLSANNRIAL